MAVYSVRLRDVVESETHYGSPMKPSTTERIEMGRQKVFDFDYPLFDEAYRKEFETKFIRKFYFTEIGFDTFGRFKFELETWLNLYMPYFNELYNSMLLKYNPLINTDIQTTSNFKKDNTQTDIGKKNQDTVNNKKFTGDVTSDSNVSGENHGTGSSNTDILSDGTNDTTKHDDVHSTITGDTSETGHQTDKTFERSVEADTPDSRLAITTEDGSGILEYASKISEDTKSNTMDKNGSTTENKEENKTSDSDIKNKTHETGNTKTDSSSDTTYSEETHSKVNDIQTTDDVGNLKEDTSKDMKANEVRDFIEHKIGKQGMMSYPEMIMEFRKALINVDEMIFNKARAELFMLVY